jgi:hypothetical protein
MKVGVGVSERISLWPEPSALLARCGRMALPGAGAANGRALCADLPRCIGAHHGMTRMIAGTGVTHTQSADMRLPSPTNQLFVGKTRKNENVHQPPLVSADEFPVRRRHISPRSWHWTVVPAQRGEIDPPGLSSLTESIQTRKKRKSAHQLQPFW